MSTFNASCPVKPSRILLGYAKTLPIIIIIIVVAKIFKWRPIELFDYAVLVFLLLLQIGNDLLERRLQYVEFDEPNERIILCAKTLIGKPKRKAIPFANAKLEIRFYKSRKKRPAEPHVVYFLKNKMEVFELTPYKDGFNKQLLIDICEEAQRLSLPVIQL